MGLRIVIDTNVVYSGLYSSEGASFQILRGVKDGKITPVLSTTLVFEYEEVLKRNMSDLYLSEDEIDQIIDNICNIGEPQKIYYLWRPFLSDPKDDHVLELAVAARTDMIVTHNIKDFNGAEKFGVKILTPKILLENIR